jgi:hypothetical protein
MKVKLPPLSASLATRKWGGRCNQDFSGHDRGVVVTFRIPEEMKESRILQSRLCVT